MRPQYLPNERARASDRRDSAIGKWEGVSREQAVDRRPRTRFLLRGEQAEQESPPKPRTVYWRTMPAEVAADALANEGCVATLIDKLPQAVCVSLRHTPMDLHHPASSSVA